MFMERRVSSRHPHNRKKLRCKLTKKSRATWGKSGTSGPIRAVARPPPARVVCHQRRGRGWLSAPRDDAGAGGSPNTNAFLLAKYGECPDKEVPGIFED